jgi:uncharacterized protein YciW
MPGDDELLRLARRAVPNEAITVELGRNEASVRDSSSLHIAHVHHPRAREALHAALLVLAGELDVAAYVARAGKLAELGRQHSAELDETSARVAALRGKP